MSDHINDHTCTHHNDAHRATAMLECPVCLLRERNEARDKVSDLVNSGAVLIALQRSERAERDALRQWKDGALAVESEWDEQALASLLNVRLGASCRKGIAEAVPKLIAERDAALRELSEWRSGVRSNPCERSATALDFAGHTLRAYEERDAAVAELARVKTKCVAPALYQLETIRTEQIMVAGFPEAATAISHARVALGDSWPEVDQDRTGYVDELEALRAEVTRHKADAEMLDWIQKNWEACGFISGGEFPEAAGLRSEIAYRMKNPDQAPD